MATAAALFVVTESRILGWIWGRGGRRTRSLVAWTGDVLAASRGPVAVLWACCALVRIYVGRLFSVRIVTLQGEMKARGSYYGGDVVVVAVGWVAANLINQNAGQSRKHLIWIDNDRDNIAHN